MLARQAELGCMGLLHSKGRSDNVGAKLGFGQDLCMGNNNSNAPTTWPTWGACCARHFSELGGALSFTAAHRMRSFIKKGETLHDKWPQLRRSRTPLVQKLRALPMVFWAKALHGTLSCVAADRHIHKLRTMAVKHLGIQLAGSNPKLRL